MAAKLRSASKAAERRSRSALSVVATMALWGGCACGPTDINGAVDGGTTDGGADGGAAVWVDPIADVGLLQPVTGAFVDITGLHWLQGDQTLLVSDRSAGKVLRSLADGGFAVWSLRRWPRT